VYKRQVLANQPELGYAAEVITAGRAQMLAASTITAGDDIESTATGLAQTKTADGHKIGVAVTSATAGDLFDVQLMQGHQGDGVARFLDDGGITVGLIVQTGTADGDVAVADANAKPFGVAAATSINNAHAYIYVEGVCEVTSGAVFAKGASLTSDAAGKAVAAGTLGNRHCIGYALDAATGADESITMIISQHVFSPVNTSSDLVAGEDLSSSQYYAVKVDPADDKMILGAAGDLCVGLVQNAPILDAEAIVATSGVATGIAGIGGCTSGAEVECDAFGTLINATGTAGYNTIGIALNDAIATAEVTVLLTTRKQVASEVIGVAAGYAIARGINTQVAAIDTIVTGLTTVVAVFATLETDPDPTCFLASADIGNQVGAPAAGSILLKTWKATTAGAGGNADPVAATAFGQSVNWFAIGTI
jgi:hypothetical protein